MSSTKSTPQHTDGTEVVKDPKELAILKKKMERVASWMKENDFSRVISTFEWKGTNIIKADGKKAKIYVTIEGSLEETERIIRYAKIFGREPWIAKVDDVTDEISWRKAGAVQTEFAVVFKSVDSKGNVAAVKLVKEITGLSLKEVKDLVDKGNFDIKDSLTKDEAEMIKDQFEKLGAVIEIV